MPLLDHFRLRRLAKAVPPPAPVENQVLSTRLDRMLERQKRIHIPSEMEQRLQALEGQYSEPLYGASAYSTPDAPEER